MTFLKKPMNCREVLIKRKQVTLALMLRPFSLALTAYDRSTAKKTSYLGSLLLDDVHIRLLIEVTAE